MNQQFTKTSTAFCSPESRSVQEKMKEEDNAFSSTLVHRIISQIASCFEDEIERSEILQTQIDRRYEKAKNAKRLEARAAPDNERSYAPSVLTYNLGSRLCTALLCSIIESITCIDSAETQETQVPLPDMLEYDMGLKTANIQTDKRILGNTDRNTLRLSTVVHDQGEPHNIA